MMTNDELDRAINTTKRLLHQTAANSKEETLFREHLNKLLQEQLKRAIGS